VVIALKQNNIPTTLTIIQTLQYTEGSKSTEYVVVLSDNSGNPSKQITLIQSKDTNVTVVTDVSVLPPPA
jgi:hypothetical protein